MTIQHQLVADDVRCHGCNYDMRYLPVQYNLRDGSHVRCPACGCVNTIDYASGRSGVRRSTRMPSFSVRWSAAIGAMILFMFLIWLFSQTPVLGVVFAAFIMPILAPIIIFAVLNIDE